jgi:uracil-DNA glycosylase
VYVTSRSTGQKRALIKDEAPNPVQMAACLPRLHGEIYHVDPSVIVALGLEAAKALCSDRVTAMRSARGEKREVEVPGLWALPSKTAKLQKWERKIRGQVVRPVIENRVRYKLLPTFHPAYLLRFQGDMTPNNPKQVFAEDMKLAATIYDRYMSEVYKVLPSEREITENDIFEER